MAIRNPIIRGFNPDPSIVRVGDYFYIANSSFSFFPGLPVSRSRDLANWELAGYAFSRQSQLPLTPDRLTGGLFAPTIRWHEGLFYVIVANMTSFKTCVVTSADPAGEWSEVHELPMMFDPDLFWDADGKCYVTYASMTKDMHNRIIARELDTDKWEMTGEEHDLWGGALIDAWCPEGPHLYKIGRYYYLLIAEGGTEQNHAVTIARSESLFGPYTGDPANPILTHRHLSMNYPICNVGHADLVDTPDGKWYIVFLGTRIYGGYHKNMGRETFIAPVAWEEDWPKVSADTGKCEWEYPAPLPEYPVKPAPVKDDFDGEKLDGVWNFIGTPTDGIWRLEGGAVYLRAISEGIYPTKFVKADFNTPFTPRALAFLGRRQTEKSYSAKAEIEFMPVDAQTCGIVVLQNNYNELRLEMARENGGIIARAVRRVATPIGEGFNPELKVESTVLGACPLKGGKAVFEIEAEGQNHAFRVYEDGKATTLAEGVSGAFMGSETAGGCIGAYVGMFCSGNGRDYENEAKFDSFTYEARGDNRGV